MDGELKNKLNQLLHAIEQSDIKEEEKKLSQLRRFLFELEDKKLVEEETKEKLKHFLVHYENIVALQKLGQHLKDVQELLDKNG
ncbi:MAG: hypothetical protein EBU93_01330 [Chlamydiae bacterium]|jgi:hypothetical protein|nr:hypothetical protein [Chlamydiota bacterium]